LIVDQLNICVRLPVLREHVRIWLIVVNAESGAGGLGSEWHVKVDTLEFGQ
jgi:calcineurin-like phosphoesterase